MSRIDRILGLFWQRTTLEKGDKYGKSESHCDNKVFIKAV